MHEPPPLAPPGTPLDPAPAVVGVLAAVGVVAPLEHGAPDGVLLALRPLPAVPVPARTARVAIAVRLALCTFPGDCHATDNLPGCQGWIIPQLIAGRKSGGPVPVSG